LSEIELLQFVFILRSIQNEPKMTHWAVSGLFGSQTHQHIKFVLSPLNKATLLEVLNSQEVAGKSRPQAKEAKGSPLRGASPHTPGKG